VNRRSVYSLPLLGSVRAEKNPVARFGHDQVGLQGLPLVLMRSRNVIPSSVNAGALPALIVRNPKVHFSDAPRLMVTFSTSALVTF